MCGRYAQTFDSDELARVMSTGLTLEIRGPEQPLQASYNVAPQAVAPVYPPGDTLRAMRWGLVPQWDRGTVSRGYSTFNARLESLLKSKLWRGSCQGRRCVVPITGYYEWWKGSGDTRDTQGKGRGKRRAGPPFYVTSRQGTETHPVMYLAGLYEHSDTDDSYTFAIVTGPAPENLGWLHDRMPCVLEPGTDSWDRWMDSAKTQWDNSELNALLKPTYNETVYTCYEVSRDVGKVAINKPYLVDSLDDGEHAVKQELGDTPHVKRETRTPQLKRERHPDILQMLSPKNKKQKK
ncbi:putative peptide hydrolase KNAG_0E02330 [Huiozyma naganishii CBS 8797]|uniref:Abasic site processing protein n=1 Tax=Huiozyma naganishii (strain ATCC MYA-139 / BCRC 22969 / CBS 8797 / KCTC 17520 / NBRC 10181 / NCYC 3082 / Yp74L-3) TaxID=1071383 RepID=J7S6Q0_HUIN7|nr:hypothetical protein KNAG_0E02330 [Kazachstania naganishii CBS 8797]CCK70494.1 hypothetical protein KNAG_0E02330 [Kazachstania naganishii CBS 8797]